MIDGFRMNSSERFVRNLRMNSRDYLNIAILFDIVLIYRCMCTPPSLLRRALAFYNLVVYFSLHSDSTEAANLADDNPNLNIK